MILAEANGFRVQAPITNLASTRGRPIKLESWGLDPTRNAVADGDFRSCAAAAGDFLVKFTGGEDIKGLSLESEHDLAAMVSDFLENGSGGGNEAKYSSDSDNGCSDLAHLVDRVLFLKRSGDQYERDLSLVVRSLLLSLNENELNGFKGDCQCNASCIRQLLAKQLRVSGYDAAVCTSKWEGFDKVPGGDHEYIDMVVNSKIAKSERLIIDIDFRSHFEIARAVQSYEKILSSLPVLYVGPISRLKQYLQIMVDAAKYSLHQNLMPLPPWRSLAYLQAKWQSEYRRNLNYIEKQSNEYSVSFDHKQCIDRLRSLKSSLQSEIEPDRLLEPITNKKRKPLVVLGVK